MGSPQQHQKDGMQSLGKRNRSAAPPQSIPIEDDYELPRRFRRETARLLSSRGRLDDERMDQGTRVRRPAY